jgi:CRP/FNR family transcriptional regulator, cyclic AMP receptor protein
MPIAIIDLIGFIASGLVFLTFCMRTILPLRLVAIASNVFFITYGAAASLFPILFLHLTLLPMNLWRTWQQIYMRRRMRAALIDTPNIEMLLPFMTSENVPDGNVIFEKGDVADRLYIVVEGRVQIEDIGKTISKGQIFGEIGLFSDQRTRTATARADGPTQVTWIDRDTIIRLYRDHPDFSLMLTRLIASRLIENQNHLLDKIGVQR